LARSDAGPEFDDAWQAQVLGIADRLVDAGVLSAKQWAEGLGAELRLAADAGAPDDKETYYDCVLAALEKLLAAAGAVSRDEMAVRVEEWRHSYLATPHGEPVELHHDH
jgi:nitrile hydratase accessory protein